jgi:hypothetical protein
MSEKRRAPRREHRRLAMALILGAALPLWSTAPASAVVVYEPAPTPAPPPPQQGGHVEVAWAGLSITFPDAWEVRQKRPPGAVIRGGAPILVAFGPASTTCTLDLYDPELVESWADVGVVAAARMTVAGLEAERFDDMLGAGSRPASAYTIHADAFQYSLLCASAEPPKDRWLSLVETIEITAPER